ncbi:MAG: NAD(P)-binding domain-containing protein [Nocardioidaceae bacterium]|nr:NAD(P)-binding domain-containing protein [Nocardioidaceae bacterium]MCL2612481.1 NAD(P)-binding domain-containing protein [Nocardioidaceae bacterium]
MERITVLGLGRMGAAMARRFADQGWDVGGWTRSGGTVEGIASYDTAADAVRDADAVVLSLFDGAACRDVLDAIEGALPDSTPVVNTSTVGPDEAADLAERIGGRYVHAPVLGSVPAVEAGTLNVLAAGATDQVRDLLTVLGNVRVLGDARAAAAQKLVVNASLAGSLVLVGEIVGQAEALGISRKDALDVLSAGPLGGIISTKRKNIDDPDAPVQFSIGGLAKDIGLLESATGRTLTFGDALRSAGDLDGDITDVTRP